MVNSQLHPMISYRDLGCDVCLEACARRPVGLGSLHCKYMRRRAGGALARGLAELTPVGASRRGTCASVGGYEGAAIG